ncbi:MAG TPA: peptidoglycan DD-metalloendopeptidase family protein [Bacteroidota bacterium]
MSPFLLPIGSCRRISVLLALLLTCCALPLHGQSRSELARRQKELQSMRDQIRTMENRIKEQKKKERVSLDLLDTYDRQTGLLHRLIKSLRAEEEDLRQRIGESRATILRLERQYGFLKDQYARYVVSIYKAGPVHDMELLLSSNSLNQLAIRNEYLRRFTAQRKRDADTLVTQKRDLEEVQMRLQVQLGDQRRLIEEKAGEEHRLAALAADRRAVLTKVRKDRKILEQSVERQTKAAKDLEGLISRLIEAEKARKEHESKAETPSLDRHAQPPASAGEFLSRRGRLRWPVSEGTVVAHFGAQKHPTLKTITQNTGIDIAVKAGTSVSAVADGEVATIWWLPGYGNLVIINHYGGYRTVYSHLADIKVAEGQHVKEGDVIAESGEAVDGPRLHFEIWKDREKQNPELWLSRQ